MEYLLRSFHLESYAESLLIRSLFVIMYGNFFVQAVVRRKMSSMSNQPKHQHWVPQFYLRYFATPETRHSGKPQIWIFSKDPVDGDEKLTSVRNICGSRYLYSPKQENGERTWELEEKLAGIEALLSQLWPDLADDFVDLGDEYRRKAVALFVAVMYYRHPTIRQEAKALHKKLVDFYVTAEDKDDGLPSIESIELNNRKYQLDTSDWKSYKNWTNDHHDRFFAETVQSGTGHMAKYLLKKRWSIVFSKVDTFITSDKPVVLQHQTLDRFGVGTEETIITFPLQQFSIKLTTEINHQIYSRQAFGGLHT